MSRALIEIFIEGDRVAEPKPKCSVGLASCRHASNRRPDKSQWVGNKDRCSVRSLRRRV
jgi:hypothetical protein